MEEIQVGEYVRTEDGLIGRLEQINKEPTDETVTYIITDNFEGMLEEIKKHSKNIIDLIEVGDYLNEHKVIERVEDSIFCEIDNRKGGYLANCYEKGLEKEIKSIVTKEQFEADCYRLEERKVEDIVIHIRREILEKELEVER